MRATGIKRESETTKGNVIPPMTLGSMRIMGIERA